MLEKLNILLSSEGWRKIDLLNEVWMAFSKGPLVLLIPKNFNENPLLTLTVVNKVSLALQKTSEQVLKELEVEEYMEKTVG